MVFSKTSTEPTSKYQNIVQKLLEFGQEEWPNFIKNLRAELEEPKVKTKDEEGKGINIPPTQLDNSFKIHHKIKTERNNKKLATDCIEHPRKTVLIRIQQKKDPERKSLVKQTERPKTKIKLNLTQNRFVDLEVMDIADQKSETNKLTK